ncbi:hypothetical protein OG863_36420 [Streptomyces decoyicus]|uniref:DNA primase n=1 Tax=Streptomyces decoyicus TaxID=249567 RepID=A0ABZ1FSY7_9ACTN|nr:hypothetical protein [Streptomyces decoyicus]WSB73000.1 hypothetical protein OG863_36420 [Streptomyces decoyicus]
MMNNAKIGVALVGGYLLGRTKKAKLAIGLGMFLAGKKLNLDPRQLGTLVANSPVLGPLNDQVRKELVDATKSAAGAALTQRMNGLADSLHERTLALDEGGTDGAGRAADDADPEPEDEPRDDAEDIDDASDAPDAESEKPAPRRKTPAKSSPNSATSSATKTATKSASAKKSTATDRSSTPRRTASSAAKTSGKAASASSRGRTSTAPGRKAAAGARNKASSKASGAARKVADRGGSNG